MDGLSVIASVAGVLSLGITVTKSLVEFYSEYKRQKTDVIHTLKKLERLADKLEILQNQLAGRAFLADEQDLLKNIKRSIQDCEECIHELQNEYVKFKDNAAHGSQDTARTSARKLAYPFRQSTLQMLDESVEEIVSHISLALQILQLKDVSEVRNDGTDSKALLELVRASQISIDIRDWLRAPDVTTNYYEACNKRHTGTGLWFVNGSSFSGWLEKPDSFLWVNGFAGCGKSVLCSTAIQYTLRHRRSNVRIGIAFFFFTFNDSAKQSLSGMLRALILQLSGQINNNGGLLSLHESYRSTMPPDQALVGCLRQLLREFDDVYIIVDALDESPRDRCRKDVLRALVDLRKWSEPSLHLLVTSRDEPDIRDVLLEELGAFPHDIISMKNDAVNGDIRSFVSGSLKSDRRLRKWEKYHDQIEKALTERANGACVIYSLSRTTTNSTRFRWVECQLTALDSCAKSKRQLDRLLASLPRSLDKTYERMLMNIGEESVEDARRILTLLCCAKRPLTTLELIEGIAVELGDRPRLNIDGRLDDEEDIHRICPGLIEVDSHSWKRRTVRIAHFSVQEYLESDRIRQHSVAIFAVNRPQAHSEVACLCLTYLLEPGLNDSIFDYPLASYAAQSWYKHYHDGDQSLRLVNDQAIRLFRSTGGEFENWIQIYDVDMNRGWTPREQVPSPLYYSSLLGLDSVLSELLTQAPPTEFLCERISDLVNAENGRCGHALQAASLGGHKKTVQLLLEKGAHIDARGGFYANALHAASYAGHEEIAQLLLEEGANVNIVATLGFGNALWSASAQGHSKIVQLLLEKGADIHALDDCEFGSDLYVAAQHGHEETVLLLLDNGANANVGDKLDIGTPLCAASAWGHVKVVQLLLERGADIDAQSGRLSRSALQAALTGGHEETIELLLQKGADVNATDSFGVTALSLAAGHGNVHIIERFFNGRCIQPNAVDIFHRSPVFYAARRGQREMIEFLVVQMQMDPNWRDCYGSTPLSAAVRNRHGESTELFLSLPNININLEDNFGRTSLWWATSMGKLHLVKLLTEMGGN
ncbi:hypothetical protein NUW58_g3758 [Xylaria curta]|uniref:Uncharacterized protein n=1 Tax=Xylaria curta TaxID=42375 RepID=A0ACC1P9E7_9PEZI|nr:hypothetical protein NUW58_g3758 [Xylaria curta]